MNGSFNNIIVVVKLALVMLNIFLIVIVFAVCTFLATLRHSVFCDM